MKIYKITNLINNKIYIGKTHKTIEERWQRHLTDTNRNKNTNIALRKSILKYGEENFKIEEIDEAKDSKTLNEKERYWISYYNSTDRKIGYNLTKGGDGNNTYEFKTSDELNEIKDKIRQTKLGKNNPRARGVKCLNTITNEEIKFSSFSECQSFFGETQHNFITRRCLHKTKCLYKGVWNMAYEGSDYLQLTPHKNIARNHPINVFIDGKWVTFGSISSFIKSQNNLDAERFYYLFKKVKTDNKTILGFRIREIDKCVSTMADECKPVGLEISTNSKQEAVIED